MEIKIQNCSVHWTSKERTSSQIWNITSIEHQQKLIEDPEKINQIFIKCYTYLLSLAIYGIHDRMDGHIWAYIDRMMHAMHVIWWHSYPDGCRPWTVHTAQIGTFSIDTVSIFVTCNNYVDFTTRATSLGVMDTRDEITKLLRYRKKLNGCLVRKSESLQLKSEWMTPIPIIWLEGVPFRFRSHDGMEMAQSI